MLFPHGILQVCDLEAEHIHLRIYFYQCLADNQLEEHDPVAFTLYLIEIVVSQQC
jgi:hypothetical protein